MQYSSLTGSGVVSPAGVVDPSPSVVVFSVGSPIIVVEASPSEVVVSSPTVEDIPTVVEPSIVVDTGTVVGHCPQVFSHLSIIFGLSHLSTFVRQNSSPSLSVH